MAKQDDLEEWARLSPEEKKACLANSRARLKAVLLKAGVPEAKAEAFIDRVSRAMRETLEDAEALAKMRGGEKKADGLLDG